MSLTPSSAPADTKEARLALDTSIVQYWLRAHGHDVAEVHVECQFGAGQSNPTYLLLLTSAADVRRRVVLRRKPPGELLKSAHDVEREYRAMAALQDTDVPVPRMVGLCPGDMVLGVPFYVMEFVDGRVLADERLPGVSPAERTAIWTSAARTLARLHAVDFRAVGLERHGKLGGGGYAFRQLDVWARQFRAVDALVRRATPDDAELHAASESMLALEAWLREQLRSFVPEGHEPTCVVHGDYRLGNLILEPHAPRVAAVIDWEISTLGHPQSDVAYFLASWFTPSMLGGLADDAPPGTPTEEEMVRVYAEAAGVAPPPPRVRAFFRVLMWQRKAAIAHGVYARALQGNAAAPDAARFGQAFQAMVALGVEAMEALQQAEPEAAAGAGAAATTPISSRL